MKKIKKNNKGFTLVELIVVMAIMAILVGALAPQVVKYVEKARESKDQQVANTLFTAVQTAIASSEETVPDFSSNLTNLATAAVLAADDAITLKIYNEVKSLSGMADDNAVLAKCNSDASDAATGIVIAYTASTGKISVKIGSLPEITN